MIQVSELQNGMDSTVYMSSFEKLIANCLCIFFDVFFMLFQFDFILLFRSCNRTVIGINVMYCELAPNITMSSD